MFSRSFKYHRPRGLLCCSGHCANCMMTVDGVPNVRVCVEPCATVQGRGAERRRLARARPDGRRRQARRAVHAGRLLLPDDDPSATRVAAVREVPAQCGRPRQGRRRRTTSATTRSIGVRACSSSAAAAPGARPRKLQRRTARVSCSWTSARVRPSGCRSAGTCARDRALRGRPGPGRRGRRPVPLPRGAHRRRNGRGRAAARLPGNDLVGRDAAGGVRRLVEEWSLEPGRRAVVVGSDDARPRRRRRSSSGAGVEIADVVDLRASRRRALAAKGGGPAAQISSTGARSTATCSSSRAGASRRTRSSRRPGRVSSTTPARHLRPARPAARRRGRRLGRPARSSTVRSRADLRGLDRRQVLRLHLRGRHRQGRRARDRRGLRLDRAREALHDGDDGPVPGRLCHARLDPAATRRRRTPTRRRSARRRPGRRGRRSSSACSPAATTSR